MEVNFTRLTNADFEENTRASRRQEDEYYALEGKKKCRGKCGVVKNLDDFHKDNKNPDQKANQCKDCRNEKNNVRKEQAKPTSATMFKHVAEVEIGGLRFNKKQVRQLIKELKAWLKA